MVSRPQPLAHQSHSRGKIFLTLTPICRSDISLACHPLCYSFISSSSSEYIIKNPKRQNATLLATRSSWQFCLKLCSAPTEPAVQRTELTAFFRTRFYPAGRGAAADPTVDPEAHLLDLAKLQQVAIWKDNCQAAHGRCIENFCHLISSATWPN